MKRNSTPIVKYLLFAFLLSLLMTIPSATAQTTSPTPTATGTPTLIVPTASITASVTPTPTETIELTPTPTPTPKIEFITSAAKIGTQYPWNKRVPVTLSITPKISGSKLEVRWQKRAGLVSSPTVMALSNPQAGQTYTVSFTLTPYATGYQRAVADIILTTNTTNYVTSQDVQLQLDAKKTVVPITTTYTFYVVAMYLTLFLIFFVAIPYGLYRLYLYAKKNIIPRWLESKIQAPT